jgi:hypothetical protein
MYNGVGGRKLREHRELKGGGSFVKTLKELGESKGYLALIDDRS